jgi:hypothetical protein
LLSLARAAVAEAARSLRALPRELMATKGWSLRDLYRTRETTGTNRLRDAHAVIDSAVRSAYGMKDSEDTPAFLLRLNLELASLGANGQAASVSGLAADVNSGDYLVSFDCIQTLSFSSCG